MSDWLIDEKGDVQSSGDPRLCNVWHCLRSPEEFARYAVTNLGFARAIAGVHGIRISWRPTFTREETIAGLLLWLRAQRETRVSISSLRTGWVVRICPSLSEAIRAIVEEFQTADCDNEGYFQARRRAIASLPADDNLGHLCRALLEKNLKCTAIELWDILDVYADRRFILTEQQGERATLHVLTWGGGYRRFGPAWVRQARGKAFEDQPDRAYARWASETYKKVRSNGEIVVEDVDASTWCPGQGRRLVRYRRLLAPIHIKDRGVFVLSAAKSTVPV